MLPRRCYPGGVTPEVFYFLENCGIHIYHKEEEKREKKMEETIETTTMDGRSLRGWLVRLGDYWYFSIIVEDEGEPAIRGSESGATIYMRKFIPKGEAIALASKLAEMKKRRKEK